MYRYRPLGKVHKMITAVDNLSKSATRVPQSQCPNCLRVLDMVRSSSGSDIKIKDGDYTVCMYCKTILEFDESCSLIYAKDLTLKKIAGTPTFTMNNELADILSCYMDKEKS